LISGARIGALTCCDNLRMFQTKTFSFLTSQNREEIAEIYG